MEIEACTSQPNSIEKFENNNERGTFSISNLLAHSNSSTTTQTNKYIQENCQQKVDFSKRESKNDKKSVDSIELNFSLMPLQQLRNCNSELEINDKYEEQKSSNLYQKATKEKYDNLMEFLTTMNNRMYSNSANNYSLNPQQIATIPRWERTNSTEQCLIMAKQSSLFLKIFIIFKLCMLFFKFFFFELFFSGLNALILFN